MVPCLITSRRGCGTQYPINFVSGKSSMSISLNNPRDIFPKKKMLLFVTNIQARTPSSQVLYIYLFI